jgi:hypothetical protein
MAWLTVSEGMDIGQNYNTSAKESMEKIDLLSCSPE